MPENKIIKSDLIYIKFFKVIFRSILNLLLAPLILILFALSPLVRVQFSKIRDDRIGHLAPNTELFLRRLELGIIKKKRTIHIGIASTQPCNKPLLEMFKRKMNIIQIPKLINEVLFSDKLLLVKSGFGKHLPFELNEYCEFNNSKPHLHFTYSEERKGRKLLDDAGISGKDWFICFHARDPEYLDKHFSSMDSNYQNFRDNHIKNYMKAAEYIASKGGYALRMGSTFKDKLPKSTNKKIIDYASKFRTEFGDIYLPAKCKFFLGNTSGVYQVSIIFEIPVAIANVVPLTYPPQRKGDIFIPKKIWSKKKKGFLTFKEILDSGAGEFMHTEQFDKRGLIPIENSAEEIRDLAVEMNEKLDGKFKYTKKDEELQRKFRSLIAPQSRLYGIPSRIGARFLRKNKFLL